MFHLLGINIWIMKNVFFIIILMLFPLGVAAQANIGDHLAFMGIPINGTLSETVRNLQKKGFVEMKDEVVDEVFDEFSDEYFGLLGKSEDSSLMKGSFYGVSCDITVNANPESKNVSCISGGYCNYYTTLLQAQQPFDRLIRILSGIYGVGKYTVTNADEKEYQINNKYGRIILGIRKIGVALENEGKYEIRFKFFDE